MSEVPSKSALTQAIIDYAEFCMDIARGEKDLTDVNPLREEAGNLAYDIDKMLETIYDKLYELECPF